MQDQHAMQLAVVTGASSGIGLELAKIFAGHGFDLLVTAESERIYDAAVELRALGARVDVVRADLATYDGVEKLYATIQGMSRPADVVCINAGIGSGGPFVETELEKELRLIQLNVASAVHLAKRVLQDMHARNEGRILFTSSVAAEGPAPFEAVYAASKAFVQSFAEALRNELKETDIVITALQPGATDTKFFERADMLDTKVGAGRKSSPADVARQGFEALMKGKDHVVAAMLKEKAMVAGARVMPETVNAEMHRKLSEPGSADR
ncbi:MAG: SDR family NAD(P)-dependent oxidoreductase [Gemmatimonadaceae bacterium]